MHLRHLVPLYCLTASAFAVPSVRAAGLELKKGDHVAIVGSGLADRQQHHAWLETLIHRAYPDLDLTIRNLGFATDEVNLHPRSDEVPTTEYFLNMNKGDTKVTVGKTDVVYKAGTDFHATVILAYWGFNESFRGPAGLEDFRKNMDAYVKTTLAANYGAGAPRLVLLSPIAHENLKDANFPDGSVNNQNLQLYSAIMAEVAAANKVQFVDLYHPSLELFSKAAKPLTINGIHLTEDGDKALAPLQFAALFGKPADSMDDSRLAPLRAAILEKNVQWHHRYRTVDQYNIYGQRSRIKYEGVDNATILGEEMAQRDVKTANRDLAVWAAAKGQSYTVKDDNLPPVSLTPPNLKNSVPYLDGEEALAHVTAPEGCKVDFMASEKTFPELINPVQVNFDTKGRLWVAVWPTYPETSPTTTNFDKLIYFDLDPKTGKPIKCTTFLDGLNCPTGFQFYKDGVIVMQSPDLWFARDTDGDGKADTKERILHGLDAADSHHETNSICYEPGGAIYLSDGVFHRTNVETYSGPVRNVNGAIYRFEPNTSKFMRHAPYGFANPHGRVFDYWGNDLITDATGNNTYFGPGFSGHLDSGAHGGYNEFWKRPSRPCPGTAILTSRHFPDDWQHTFLNANVIGFQGIFRAKVSEDGGGLKGETVEPPLVQTDVAKNPNFRPSGMTVAPDGSIYFMDWSQMLIGHLQHHLRDPNRDHQHGRLYRITYPSRPLLEPKPVDGQPIAKLLDLLKEPENDVRLRAKIELSKHATSDVIPAVQAWAKQFDPNAAGDAHHLLEALWVHQWNNVVNPDLIAAMLKSPEPRARAQAVRVVCYQRDRIPNALDLVIAAVSDPAPRVRLEAVRTLSFFRGADTVRAIEAANLVRNETEYYINYCYKETMKQLGSLPEGKDLVGNDAALQAALKPKAEIQYGPTNKSLSKEDLKVYNLGRKVFSREAHCITCHQADGNGLPNIYPPLVKTEWVAGDPTRFIKIVLKGLYGPMSLHGKEYGPEKGTPPMTAFGGLLKDDELAAVVSYVRQSFGNDASIVTPDQVKAVREATNARQQFYMVDEILKEHPIAFNAAPASQPHITYPPKEGPGAGKHIVFISGDEEYRSEESLPMLAKILSQRHGFKCTVLFSLAADGTIDPNNQKSISSPEQLDTADGIVILTRFRQWPEADLKHFVDAVNRGVPILGLRTATHALSGAAQKPFGDFGENVLGENWISHWGKHMAEATQGIIEPSAAADPLLNGVTSVFGLTDVYEAHPPADAKILLRGQSLAGLKPDSPPANYEKNGQGINNPMMPIAWTRSYKNSAGKTNAVFCTTMGDATDLESEGLRRLVVNAVYQGFGLPVPGKADVTYVDPYEPSFYSGGGFRKGMRPQDLALGKSMPGKPLPKPAGAQ